VVAASDPDKKATIRKATAKDVALLAGVKQPTVSLALNGAKSGTRISEATRQRIVQAAAELGYRPNSSARAMKSGRFGSVAVLTSANPARGHVQTAMLNGIHDELAANGQHLMLMKAPDESLTDEYVMPRLLQEWTVDGLLVGLNQEVDEEAAAPPRMVEIIERYHIPSIWLNVVREWDCVRPDDEQGGFDATRYLLELGHRRIAYVGPPRRERHTNHYSQQHRKEGHERAMREAGLALQVLLHDGDAERRQQLEAAYSWLAASRRPSAMVFYTGAGAVMALQAAQMLGLRVPEELSLVAIDDMPARHPLAVVDTFEIPFQQLGRNAVQQLLRKIEKPDEFLPPRTLPLTLVRGETCAHAPRS
jgi:LacI family transcriptional regulator